MIKVQDIHKSFGQLEVLKGITFEIGSGEILSVTGPSGAGKTTLLQIIGSLERPDSGRVEIDSQNIFALSESRLSRLRNATMGFVFQFHQLLPEFTAQENMALPALIAGRSRRQAMDDAERLADILGLKGRLSHRPSELSGGERQRVAVGRALINSPRIVLADEPTGSLDTANRNELHRLFFRLRDELGQTFVIVTHDENLASDADRVIHIVDGRVATI